MSDFDNAPRTGPIYGLPAPLGRYTLIERLGVGGMAEVFLATLRDELGGESRHVVKRCLPHLLEDPRFIEMFLREGHTASRLHHANIVEMREIGHVGNAYFLVMEYVDGITLRKLALRSWGHRRALPMELIVSAVADAALGLHHAHTLCNDDGTPVNLVHRDVSPENLIIDRHGVTKLLDFGIARAADASALTKTGELKGKIPYMAPEQIRGAPLDARVDIYALGVTLYWMLAARRPHRAPTELALLNEILFTPVEPPSAFNPRVPPALDALVMAMLARDPAQRPQTALLVHDALAATLAQRAAQVAPYVNEVLALPEPPARDPMADPDEFTDAELNPATPLTTLALSTWEAPTAALRFEPHIDVPNTAATPAPSTAPQRPSKPRAPRARPTPVWVAVAAGGAGALALALVAALVLRVDPGASPAIASVDAGTRLDVVDAGIQSVDAGTPAAVAPVAVADVPDAGGAVVDEASALVPTEPPDAPEAPVGKKTRKVQLRAPAHVAWLVSRGVTVRGNGSADVPSTTRSVRAQDKTTGGISTVPVDAAGVADFDKLGTGTLEVRALPFASVTLGPESLGTTPFSPRSLVEGTYEVVLKHESSVEKRTVRIVRGRTERVVVDFRKR